ncbi:hypothetical protein [Amycolatopsis arida]|uniref:hypothetical protein n=1 Tax=Amycolatopsis arida TaxID=587909 RepID=UPI0010656844|nr:hypothetical protein [Amycolatopsis arida]
MITVNGARVELTLDQVVPDRARLYLGRYASDPGRISTADDLRVGRLDSAALRRPAGSALRYVGYYAARLHPAGGDHLPEVTGRSNLNWVNISDYDRYRPETLADCAPRSCVVYAGHEFFDCASGACRLHAEAERRWGVLAAQVRPYLDRVGAFYLLDEPFHRGATFADVRRSARLIEGTYPDVPVMMEAGPKVDANLRVPDEVDWVGFDWYCRPMAEIERLAATLERQAPGRPVFLLPEAAPRCPGQTDAVVAQRLREYPRIAEARPRVAGLMLFGPWTGVGPGDPPAGRPTPSKHPRSGDAVERIAARILGATR